ncbi:MAG TPA: iron ABC transporter permease [Pseudomonadales bacterium]
MKALMRAAPVFVVLGIALLSLLLWALDQGPMDLALWQALSDGLRGESSMAGIIVWEVRLPRVLLAVLVGGALGLAGAAMQGFLRNPLADPGILGVSGSAAFGAVLVLYFGWAQLGWFMLPLGGLLGALAAVVLILLLAGRASDDATLVLAGLAVSSFAAALIALTLNLARSPYAMSEMVYWMLGSVANRSMLHVQIVLPFLLTGSLMLLAGWRYLEVLTLGNETAHAMGFKPQHWRWWLVCGIALCVGAAVSVSGAVGFVGLMVPHLVRPLVGFRPGVLMPASALAGSVLLLLADLLVQALPGKPLQLGVVTALMGAPFFFYLVMHQRRSFA